ncbi:MAG: type II secretion system protein [Acidobacteriota bacterium]
MNKKAKGFTLIELLIVVAIIGILAALLIPNAITAMQKAKQKGTMKDVSTISSVMVDYMTDNGVVYNQNGTYTAGSAFYTTMSPFYITVLPVNDQWGNAFSIWGQTACDGQYGVTGSSNQDFVVASFGRDNTQETGDFVTTPGTGMFTTSSMASFDYDLVMWNGSWIRGPQTRVGGSGS